jgi:hypothetical protein
VDVLLDTDTVIKLHRYSLILSFQDMMRSKGWSQPPYCSREALYNDSIFTRIATSSGRDCTALKDDVQQFLRTSHALPASNNAQLLQQLSVPGIDSGELQLFGYAIMNPNCLMLTGDKVAMKAMATQKKLDSFRIILQNRIVHVEQLVQCLATRHGIKNIRERVCLDQTADSALYQALESRYTDYEAQQRLDALIAGLNRLTHGLMVAPLDL